MPIFEYSCKGCGKEFEALVLPTTGAPSCPACQGTELEKLISSPAIKSETTHALAMKAAQKRDKKAGAEKAREQREYELHHND
ncbi:MAG TPA: FmdB family zinc ribbon protein [Vicinamibacterales bacterium]|nr:FmdB family zinc ribbon protein [Vicinamibacterales bacterium]